MDVSQAHVDQRLQLDLDVGDVGQNRKRIGDGEIEDIRNGVTVELYAERLLVVTPSIADFAEDVDIRKEVHLYAALAVTLAGFATSALDVEAEASGLVPTLPAVWKHGEEIADGGKDASISGRVGTWCATDRGLMDLDDLVELLCSENRAMQARLFLAPVEKLCQRAVKNVVD